MIFKKLFFIIILYISITTNIFCKEIKKNNSVINTNNIFNLNKFYFENQINIENINELELDFIYKYERTNIKNTIQLSPVFAGKCLVTADLNGNVICLNPQNGQEIWKKKLITPVGKRGVTIYGENIFAPTGRGIQVLVLHNGKLNNKIGNNGSFGNKKILLPPIIDKNIIFVATYSNGVQAYDVGKGSLLWSQELLKNGSQARVWSGFNYDKENNTLYVITGNDDSKGHLWSGFSYNKKNNKLDQITSNKKLKIDKKNFSNSIIAIDSTNGKIKNIFQESTNEKWDLDMVGTPLIFAKNSFDYKNKNSGYIIALSKTGNNFFFSRKNNKPLFNFIEKKINNSDSSIKIVTEPQQTSKINFHLTDDINKEINKENLDYIKFKLRNTKKTNFLEIPSVNYDVAFFGLHGGAEWPGGSVDYRNNQIVIPVNKIPFIWREFYYESRYHKIRDKIRSKDAYEGEPWSPGLPKTYLEKFFDYSYSKLPSSSLATEYVEKCSSCHGRNRQGEIYSEIRGDKYYPPLVGLSFTDKFEALSNLDTIKKVHLFNKEEIKINQKELDNIKDNFIKIDKYLEKKDLLRKTARWQILLDKNDQFISNPPYGKIISIDLNTAIINWEIAFGEENINGKKIQGTMNFGGLISTNGGLIFATGTTDKMLRSYNAENGNELWNYKMKLSGSAPPSSYTFNGCQRIAVNASGGKYAHYRKYGEINSINDNLVSENYLYTFKLKKCS
jgi:quinoprotein glucose dehydrogenase